MLMRVCVNVDLLFRISIGLFSLPLSEHTDNADWNQHFRWTSITAARYFDKKKWCKPQIIIAH